MPRWQAGRPSPSPWPMFPKRIELACHINACEYGVEAHNSNTLGGARASGMTPACACCRSALRDSLQGIALCIALGGLAALLFGAKSLWKVAPLPVAHALTLGWFSLCVLCTFGAILTLLGLAAGLGFTAPMHFVSGSLVWPTCWPVWLRLRPPSSPAAARDHLFCPGCSLPLL